MVRVFLCFNLRISPDVDGEWFVFDGQCASGFGFHLAIEVDLKLSSVINSGYKVPVVLPVFRKSSFYARFLLVTHVKLQFSFADLFDTKLEKPFREESAVSVPFAGFYPKRNGQRFSGDIEFGVAVQFHPSIGSGKLNSLSGFSGKQLGFPHHCC